MAPPQKDTFAAPRRELATRNARWAATLARALGRAGIRPNGVSIAGVVFAAGAGLALALTPITDGASRVALLLLAAACIQLRLLCNLLDGMLAVEEGFKSKTGDLFNDLPDRLADIVIFVGAGYAARDVPYGVALGWAAAVLAVFTAYIRVLAGSLKQRQHFIGPMAKQHRMFTLTLATVLASGEVMAAHATPCHLPRPGRHCGRIGGDGCSPHRATRPRAQRRMIAGLLAGVCRLITGTMAYWRCDPQARGQRIYFGNHSSHLDFVVIWSALPSGLRRTTWPVAGRDYWDRGVIRRYLAGRVFKAVLIERGAPGAARTRESAQAAITQMATAMGTLGSLIVFPEGTRSTDGEIGPFRSGLYHLSKARPDVELIPVYLQNLNRILPKGELLPVPMLSRVIFGPPLAAIASEDKDVFLARARQALLELKATT